MDRLEERLSIAARALATFRELADLGNPSDVERDAAIQRFEYTFEAVWKAGQLFLRDREGVETGSPKACVRAAREAGRLSDSETEAALTMADDRNLSVHAYNEDLAKAIFSRLAGHGVLLAAWPSKRRVERERVPFPFSRGDR